MKRVRSADDADCDSIIVTLFRCSEPRVRGWLVGPVSLMRAGLSMPYIPPSRKMIAEIAIVRAQGLAAERELPVCIVDPDNLWPEIWAGGH